MIYKVEETTYDRPLSESKIREMIDNGEFYTGDSLIFDCDSIPERWDVIATPATSEKFFLETSLPRSGITLIKHTPFEGVYFFADKKGSWGDSKVRAYLKSEEFANRCPTLYSLTSNVMVFNNAAQSPTYDRFWLPSISDVEDGFYYFVGDIDRRAPEDCWLRSMDCKDERNVWTLTKYGNLESTYCGCMRAMRPICCILGGKKC